MTKKQFLQALEEKGLPIRSHNLEYLVTSGQIPRPVLNDSLDRVWSKKHLNAVVSIYARRERERNPTPTKE